MSDELRAAMEREAKKHANSEEPFWDSIGWKADSFEAGAQWMAGEAIKHIPSHPFRIDASDARSALADIQAWLEGALKP